MTVTVMHKKVQEELKNRSGVEEQQSEKGKKGRRKERLTVQRSDKMEKEKRKHQSNERKKE